VIQIPGEYPQTGSINIFHCINREQPNVFASTDAVWYDQAHSVVRRLSDWHRKHTKAVYPTEEDFYRIGSGSGSPYPSGSFTGFHIPSMFYGRNIATGSVLLTVNSFIGAGFGLDSTGTLFWKDDGIGRLWQVPSSTSDWQSGTQVVGNVFYNEGLIVFTHPYWRWHEMLLSGSTHEPHVTLQFDGSYHIKSMLAMCRMNPGDVNGSNNPTYYITDETGKRWARDWDQQTEAITYVTAIGLYNEERQLVAVAKIAQPIRKRERDDIDIKLRMDL
jgi:hypothetical protein